MALKPGYGETSLSDEEAEALIPAVRELLGAPARRADLYDLEQLIQDDVADTWWSTLLDLDVPMRDLLDDHFVRDLHRQLYGPIWAWAGRQRSRETNIGVAPAQIAVELRNALDDLYFRWAHDEDLTPRWLGIATHAALVRIHPFVDGNGRVTRLLADLVYLCGQSGGEPIHAYDWDVDRSRYIALLHRYDATRDPSELVEFVPVVNVEGVAEGVDEQ